MTPAPTSSSYERQIADLKRIQRRIILFFAALLTGGNLLIPREFLAVVALLMSLIWFGGSQDKGRKDIIFLWIGLAMLLAFLSAYEIDVLTNLIRLVNFVVGFFLLRIYSNDDGRLLTGDIKAIFGPMAYQAILTVAVAIAAPDLFLNIQFGEASCITFLGLLNYHSLLDDSSGLVRPDGFFFEPGVFQFYLNLLVFVLFAESASWRRMALPIIAVLTTRSTTGIAILAFQILYFTRRYLLFNSSTKSRVMTLILASLLVYPLFQFASANFIEKFQGYSSGSFNSRYYDLTTALLLIREHPFFGIGFNYSTYLVESLRVNLDTSMLATDDVAGRPNANGLLIVLYSMGIPLGAFYLINMLRQTVLPHKLVVAIIIISSLLSEYLSLNPIFAFFAFSGMSRFARTIIFAPSAPTRGISAVSIIKRTPKRNK
jgi:hypothetical protein